MKILNNELESALLCLGIDVWENYHHLHRNAREAGTKGLVYLDLEVDISTCHRIVLQTTNLIEWKR